MSKRLQVLLDESEMAEFQRIAKRHQLTLAEWVRRTLRAAERQEPTVDADKKLKAIRAASRHSFPTSDIDGMLAEIEKSYGASSKVPRSPSWLRCYRSSRRYPGDVRRPTENRGRGLSSNLRERGPRKVDSTRV